MSLVFTEEADLQLRQLENDPTQPRLLRVVHDVLEFLEANPDHERSRARRYLPGERWRMAVPGFDWMVIWRRLDDDQLVVYVGPGL